jgi:hypothetical protein
MFAAWSIHSLVLTGCTVLSDVDLEEFDTVAGSGAKVVESDEEYDVDNQVSRCVCYQFVSSPLF